MKGYPIEMEVDGDFALFARPDTGSEVLSYPFPTWTAIKGMIEAVRFYPNVSIIPYKVEVCNPVQFTDYAYSYWGCQRKSQNIKKGNQQIVNETVLANVCYRVYAEVYNRSQAKISEYARKKHQGNNHAHAFQSQFQRDLKRGRCRHNPVLGRSEMLCNYWGPLREETVPIDSDMIVPLILHRTFNAATQGEWKPVFAHNVRMTKGVVDFREIQPEQIVEI